MMIYELRYYFFGVPHDKHYGCRTFDTLDAALFYVDSLDSEHVECFEINLVQNIHRQCISLDYCPATTKCKRCKFKREGF